MDLRAERFTISLRTPFRIAHGSSTSRDTILVHLRDEDGREGHGEGALPPYYPSRAEACLEWLAGFSGTDLRPLLEERHSLPSCPPAAMAGRVALEIALHDLRGQRSGKPLWKSWGLDPASIPSPALTLSIPADEAELTQGLTGGFEAGFRHFKLKAGSGDLAWDAAIFQMAKTKFPAAKFSVDANAGWSAEDAAEIIPSLEGCEYVEQPVAAKVSEWRKLRDRLGTREFPPLVADESAQALPDIADLRGLADGINVKLLKAGGLSPARQWLDEARRLGIRTMVGVMVETGIGRTAAAQLAPLAEWLDIDPPLTIPAAPMIGCRFVDGKLLLSERPGLGLEVL